MSNIGGFGGLFHLDVAKVKDPVLVASTDGVGTKLKIARMINKHDTIITGGKRGRWKFSRTLWRVGWSAPLAQFFAVQDEQLHALKFPERDADLHRFSTARHGIFLYAPRDAFVLLQRLDLSFFNLQKFFWWAYLWANISFCFYDLSHLLASKRIDDSLAQSSRVASWCPTTMMSRLGLAVR